MDVSDFFIIFAQKYIMDKREETMEQMFQELQEYSQYEAIPYAGEFKCPACGGSGHGYQHIPGDGYKPIPDARLVGWCSTKSGYMMVYECVKCFEKFRYHNVTTERNNWDKFKNELWLVWFLQTELK